MVEKRYKTSVGQLAIQWFVFSVDKPVQMLPIQQLAFRNPTLKDQDRAKRNQGSCVNGKDEQWQPLVKLTITTKVGGRKLKAIVDTGCVQMFIQAKLAPAGRAPEATPINMICMHG